MSAFMVDKEHIDVLVAVGLRGPSGREVSPDTAWYRLTWYSAGVDGAEERHELDYTTADSVGEMLVSTNFESICSRYPDVMEDPTGTPGPLKRYWEAPYRWTDPRYRPTAVEALKAIGCFEYQSCEHAGWVDSEAKAFCESLRHSLINALPGMREAPWDWSAEKLAELRAGRVVAS
jgi:hypothetical protein